MKTEKDYMRIAMEEGKKGKGYVYPNPMVGAVIVKHNRVIAKGYHRYFGGAHAEIEALSTAGKKVKGADLYVTLEPCSHQGKTPPCADEIIKAGIKKVVIAMKDPNPIVKSRGIGKLKRAGIEVKTGILGKSAEKMNRDYMKYIKENKNRKAHVILKIAMTMDGKIATYSGDSKWITCEASRNYVHKLRGNSDAIITGINTVLTDNPLLTARTKGLHKNPVRIILDSYCRIPLNLKIISDKSAKTVIMTSNKASSKKIQQLRKKGIEVIIMPVKDGHISIKSAVEYIKRKNIKDIMIEAGAEVNFNALNSGVVDEVYVFIAPKIIGGKEAKSAVSGKGIKYFKDSINIKNMQIERVGIDILIRGGMR